MPVRQMTGEESERIFGSGLVIFGMKRPTPRLVTANNSLTGIDEQTADDRRGVAEPRDDSPSRQV